MAKDDTLIQEPTGPQRQLPTLENHPRAQRSIETTRAWAAVAAFAAVVLLSLQADIPAFDAIVRGLIASAVAFVLAWTVAITIWRELVRMELVEANRKYEEKVAAQKAEREEELARRAEELQAELEAEAR